MKYLFAGEGNAFSYCLCNLLQKEGHDINWISDDEKAYLGNELFKGKVYKSLHVAEEIERIITLHSVRTIVFFAPIYRNQTSVRNDLPMLEALLKAVTQCADIQFVYLSSMETIYSESSSERVAKLRYGEMLCEAYQKNQNIPLLILRSSMIYADYPRDHMGYMGYALSAIESKQTISCVLHEEDYIDTIYGVDAAYAAYQLMELEKCGTYCITSGYPITLRQLHYILGEVMQAEPRVKYSAAESTSSSDIFERESQTVKKETGWVPMVLFDEDRNEVKALATDKAISSESDKLGKKNSFISRIWQKDIVRGVIETLVLFVIMHFLSVLTSGITDFRFVDIRLLFVMLIAIMFGTYFGLFAAVLACISYVSDMLGSRIDISYLLYSVDSWLPFIAYIFAGGMFGYLTDKKNDRIDEAEEKYGNLIERYTFLKMIHKDLLSVKAGMQQRLLSSKESFGKVYEVTEKLNSLSPERILVKAVEVVSDTLGSCDVAVYEINPQFNRYARRTICSRQLCNQTEKSLDLSMMRDFAKSLESEKIFVNIELKENHPDFAAPVYSGGNMIAFIAAYHVPADMFTLYHQNLFRVLGGLIENNLVKALEYEAKRKSEMYVNGSTFLTETELADRISIMQDQTEDTYYGALLLKIINTGKLSMDALSHAVETTIRNNDFAGIDPNGNIIVTLVGAAAGDYDIIAQRFAAKGLEVMIC